MMQAHRDRRNNAMKWWVLLQTTFILRTVGTSSPYPWLDALGAFLQLITTTVGLYLLVMKVDKDAVQNDVQNGYKVLVGFGLSGSIQMFNLGTTGLDVNRFAIATALMIFQTVVLKVMIPVAKKCFGDDERKLWSYTLPAVVLALELGPCLLLLGSDMATLEFWLLIVWQELNSVAKNTGLYAELYVAVRALLRRPVGEEDRKLMEERRSTIAPCDNMGEIVSPIVIMMVLGLEAAFEWLPFERAPYLARNGILGGWRNQMFRGEATIMLAIVLLVRIVFCYIEVRVRAYQSRNDSAAASGENRSAETGAIAHRARQPSMAVLYQRIVLHSDDAPVHMQHAAAAVFTLQPIFFVLYAAIFGKYLHT